MPLLPLLIILDDAPPNLAARRKVIDDLFAELEIPCDIKEAGSKKELQAIVDRLQQPEQRRRYDRILLLSDVVMEYGSTATTDLASFLSEIWNTDEEDWWGRVRIIIYTTSDIMHQHLKKKLRARPNRNPKRDIIYWIKVRGHDRQEELRTAIREWLS